jgi:hypothetical protein
MHQGHGQGLDPQMLIALVCPPPPSLAQGPLLLALPLEALHCSPPSPRFFFLPPLKVRHRTGRADTPCVPALERARSRTREA